MPAGIETLLAPAERRAPQPRKTEDSDSEASVSDGAEDENDAAPAKAESIPPPQESLAPHLPIPEVSEPEDDVDQAEMDRKEAKRKKKEEKRARKEEKRRRKEEKRARKQEATRVLEEQQSLAIAAGSETDLGVEPEVAPESSPHSEPQAERQAEVQTAVPPSQPQDQMDVEEASQTPAIDEKQARKEARRLKRAAKNAQKEVSAAKEQESTLSVAEVPPAEPMEVDLAAEPEPSISEPKQVETAPEPEPETEPATTQKPLQSMEAEVASATPSHLVDENKHTKKEAKRLRKEARKARKSAALLEAGSEEPHAQRESAVLEEVASIDASGDIDIPTVEDKPRNNKRQRHDASEAAVEDEGPSAKRRKSEDESMEDQPIMLAFDAEAVATTVLPDTGAELTKKVSKQSAVLQSADDSILPSMSRKGVQSNVGSDSGRHTINVTEKAGRTNDMLPPPRSSLRETLSPLAARGSPSETRKGQQRRTQLAGSQRKLANAGADTGVGAARDVSVDANVNEGADAGIDATQRRKSASKDDDAFIGMTAEERKKAKRKMQKLRGRTRERNERLSGLPNANVDATQETPVKDHQVAVTEEPKETSPAALPEEAQEERQTPALVESAESYEELQAATNGYTEENEAASVEDADASPMEEPAAVHEESGAVPLEEPETTPLEATEAVHAEEPEAVPVEESKADRKKRKMAEKDLRRAEKALKKQRKEERKKLKMQEADELEAAQLPAPLQAADEDEVPEHSQESPAPKDAIESHDTPIRQREDEARVLDDQQEHQSDRELSLGAKSAHDNDMEIDSPKATPAQIENITQDENQDSVLSALDQTDVEGEAVEADLDAGGDDEPALDDDNVLSEAPHSPVPDSESEGREEITQTRAVSEELGEETLFDSIPPGARHDVHLQSDEQLSDLVSEKSNVDVEDDSEIEDADEDAEPIAESAPVEEIDLSSDDDVELPEVFVTMEHDDDQQDNDQQNNDQQDDDRQDDDQQDDDQQDDPPMLENSDDGGMQGTSSTEAKDSPLATPSRPSGASRSPSWTFDQYEAVVAAAADYLQTKPENHGFSVSIEGLRNFTDENPTLPQWFSLMEQSGITFDRSELIEALQAVAPIDEAVRERLTGRSQPAESIERNDAALQYLSEQVLLHPDNGLLWCVKMYHIGEICQELGVFQNGAAEDLPAKDEVTKSASVAAESQSRDASPAPSAVDTGKGSTSPEDGPPLRRSARARNKKSAEEQNPTPERSRPASVHSVDPRLAKLAMSAMEMYDEHANSEDGAASSQAGAGAEAELPAMHDAEMGDAHESVHGDVPRDHEEESHEQQNSEPELATPTQREPAALEPTDSQPTSGDPANTEAVHTSATAESGNAASMAPEPMTEEDPVIPEEEDQPLIVVQMRSLDSLKPGESFEVLRNGVHALKVSVSDSPADRAFLRGARMEVLKAIRKAMELPQEPCIEMTAGSDLDENGGSDADFPGGGSEAEERDGEPDMREQDEDIESEQQNQDDNRQDYRQEVVDAQEDTSDNEMGDMLQDEQMNVQRDGQEAIQHDVRDEVQQDVSEDEVLKVLQRTRRVANIEKPRNATDMLHAELVARLGESSTGSHAPRSSQRPPRSARSAETTAELKAHLTSTHSPEPLRRVEKRERPEKPADELCQRCHKRWKRAYFDDAAAHWICKACYDRDQRALKTQKRKSSRLLSSSEEPSKPRKDTPTLAFLARSTQ
jgi:hypothetical protein